MTNFPTVEVLVSELTQLRAVQQENTRLQERLQRLQNDLGFQAMSMKEIAQIVKLPPDKTMADLVTWIRDNWKTEQQITKK